MKELISKQDLIHDLYTLPLSLQDAEMVEEWINNYEGYDESLEIKKLKQQIDGLWKRSRYKEDYNNFIIKELKEKLEKSI